MTEKKTSLFRHRLELLILTESEDVLQRAKQIVTSYFLTFKHFSHRDVTVDSSADLIRAQIILMVQEEEEELAHFAGRVDRALHMFPRSRFVTVMASSFSRENLEGTQNPRVTALSRAEFFNTLKFEYLCLYRCRSQFYDVQLTDFFPMTTMLHACYVRLPINQRYLPVIFKNTVLSEERFQRLEKRPLYIRQSDSLKYYDYIQSYYDSSGVGLRKKARALFLALNYYSLALNESVLFDFKSTPENPVEKMYEKIQEVAQALFEIMRSDENLWDVFREAHEDEFSEFWRAPWVAVYAAMMSVKSGVGDPMVTLLSGLLMDLGLYDLDEATTRSYLLSPEKNISETMKANFEKHPLLSLNRVLIKKVPVSEPIKGVIVCTHETVSEAGFPNQVPQDKLPVEAQLLMFAEAIDKEVLTIMKKNGVGFRFLKEKMWEQEKNSGKNYSVEFLAAIAESLI